MTGMMIQDHYIHKILKNNIVSDEWHIGGRVATEYLLAALSLRPGMRVLDVGAGLGAAARAAATLYKVQVTGIDLVPELCTEATRLTAEKGLSAHCQFQCGSAVAMPFEDNAFGAVFMLHVSMNIKEKQILFKEIARVLQKNSQFSFYEILADEHVAGMVYPCPWASVEEGSFLAAPYEIDVMLAAAGFMIEKKESRRDFALDALMRFTEKCPEQPVVNLLENIRQNRCVPWQYVCRKV